LWYERRGIWGGRGEGEIVKRREKERSKASVGKAKGREKRKKNFQ
jgi:hypothetical protein